MKIINILQILIKNKDIYLENIDTREVTFINFCDQCYGDDSVISCHTVSNYS